MSFTSRAQRSANRSRSLQDAVRLLSEGGCPVCRRRADSDRLWVRSFVLEGNVEPDVLNAVGEARGFCPEHFRRLLERTDAAFILPNVLTCIALAQADDLGERRRGEHPACPACRSRTADENDTLQALGRGAASAEVCDALQDAALCLPHTRALLSVAPEQVVVESFTARFAQLSGIASLQAITGADGDADARAGYLEALCRFDESEMERMRGPVRRRLIELLGLDSCPCCRVAGTAPVRYLRWLVATRQDFDRDPEPVETALCARHLHDLSSLDPLTAGWLADLEHPTIDARLSTLDTALADGGSRRGAGEHLARYDRSIRECPACRAGRVAADRMVELVTAALPDANVRRAMEDGHGLCAGHALATGDPFAAQVTRARLQLLTWELTESRRKREWWTRHEHQGSEMASWRRAPTWLRGDTYLGLATGEHKA